MCIVCNHLTNLYNSYMASYAAYALNAFMSVTDTNAILNRA